MSNFNKLMKFLFVFITFSFGGTYLYNEFVSTEADLYMKKYSDSAIRKNCPSDSEKIYYQECFRRDIGKVMSLASPRDIPKIFEALNDLRKRDEFQAKEGVELAFSKLLYFENTVILMGYLSEIQVSRNGITFLDIVLIPFLGPYVKKEVTKIKSDFTQFEGQSDSLMSNPELKNRLEQIQRKINSIETNKIELQQQ